MSSALPWVRRALPLGLLVLVPLSVVTAPAANGAAPTQLAPSSTTVGVNTPTLSWVRPAGAARFEVTVDDDANFSSPVFSGATTNTRVVPDKPLPTGQVHWRVRALSTTSTHLGTSGASFTVAAFGAPTQLTPNAEPSAFSPTKPPVLSWQGIQGATSYTVEIDVTDAFTNPLTSGTTGETRTTSFVPTSPLPEGDYFWRVRATKGTGINSAFSDPASFAVAKLPAVTVTSPDDSPENKIDDVVLEWTPVAGAAFYQVQVSTDTGFNTLVDPVSTSSDATTKVLGTRYSPKVTYDNNQYYWRVRAVDAAGKPAPWSQIQAQFDRTWQHTPAPVHPLGSADGLTVVTGDMYFEWTPVPLAAQYQLQLGTDPNFSPGTFTECQVAGTTYMPGLMGKNHVTGTTSVRPEEDCVVTPGTVHYWRVRPMDRLNFSPVIEGLYSPTQQFQFRGPQPTGSFTNVSPVGGQTVDVPTLSWDPYEDADHYEVRIFNRFGSQVKTATTYSTSYTPVDSALKAADGPFSWQLTARRPDRSAASLTYDYTFSLSGSPPADTAAAPLTPLSGRPGDSPTVRAPALTWEAHPDAAYYQLFVGPHGSGTWYSPLSQEVLAPKKLPYAAVTDTWTRFLNPGQYDWMVRAHDATGAVLEVGVTSTFRIASLAPVQGQRIALTGTELATPGGGCHARVGDPVDICSDVPATPVLDWDPVEGAGHYMVYLSEDATFTNLVEPLTGMPATTSTRWTPTLSSHRAALADSQAGGAYYWFVRPCKTSTVCGPDPVSRETGWTNRFRKQSPAVVPTAPSAGATVATPAVTFDWQDYLPTNQANVWSLTGEASHQSAMGYRIQVDNDATFSSPLETVDVDQSTYTSAEKLYPEGLLHWRVQAIDAEGNALTWSPARAFTKATPALVLTTPTAGQAIAGTGVFRWGSQDALGSYQLEVYRNADTNASSANKLFGVTSIKQAAFVWTSPIPAASSAYVWRVRRMDSASPANPGPWSAWGRFTSTGTAPSLLSPAHGSWQHPNGPLFSWHPVPGAASYTLETRGGSGYGLPGTPKTTAATAWATTSVVPDGRWEWRVVAKDAGNNTLGASGWRVFSVDATRPTVKTWAPTSSARPWSNFVVTFSEPVRNVTRLTYRIKLKGTNTWLRAPVTISADRKRAVLNPYYNLRLGRQYVVQVTNGVTDPRGNSLVPKGWTVTVR